jgi:hypothetical protein
MSNVFSMLSRGCPFGAPPLPLRFREEGHDFRFYYRALASLCPTCLSFFLKSIAIYICTPVYALCMRYGRLVGNSEGHVGHGRKHYCLRCFIVVFLCPTSQIRRGTRRGRRGTMWILGDKS